MSRPLGFLAPPMRVREQTHRRLVLWGIAALVLLSLSPVVGHHLSSRVDALVMGHDHVWNVCVIALHTLLGPVHGVFHVLLIAGLLYAVVDRLRAVARLRRTLSLLAPHTSAPAGNIAAAMHIGGLPPRLVRVVQGLPNPAFTAGWWSPAIYLAREVADVLTTEQLVAVLAHEAEHVRRRDPLRLSLLRFLGCTLFWIPAFRRLAADMADEAEIAADDASARDQPLVLASAILSLAAWPGPVAGNRDVVRTGAFVSLVENGAAHGTNHDALLERRVRRLAGETAAVSSHLTRRSLLGAGAILGAVWTSGIVVAHPMPVAGAHAHDLHCDHPGESALVHLFCRGGLIAHGPAALPGADACPHAKS